MVSILDYLLYMKRRALPAEYVRLPYIKSTGTQRIATGVTGALTAEMDIQFIETGKRQLMGYNLYGANYWGMSTDKHYELGVGRAITGEDPTKRHIVKYETEIDNEIIAIELSVGGETVAAKNRVIPTEQYSLFIAPGVEVNAYACSAKLYGAKIYQGGNKVREFVPCYRKADNVKGLYDIVNGVFYTNVGTGEFE